MCYEPYALLTREKIKHAFDFYVQSGLIQGATSASFEAAANKALAEKYCLLDINYFLQMFGPSVFYFSEDYGIAFTQRETSYSHVFEQLVSDLATFTAYRFCPEPLSIKVDEERNGTISFVQKGLLFERALFTGAHYLANLLTLLNEAIVAHGGDAVSLYVLCFSDAEQEAFVLLSKAQRQQAKKEGLLTFNF
ncbi:MAG: hypothetical protein EOO60_07890 [Hymenobacter sp.]|nr:MAG: hypothetical protein EOO60_07890 [Hymenobacter sp.]